MFNKKRLIVLVTFLAALFFMTMYAGGGEENAPIATRVVKFIDGYNDAEISTQNVNLGEEATKPADPEHRNLLFSGWFSGDNRVTDFTNIMENLTVISRYVDDINNNGKADSDETPFIVTFYDTIDRTNIRVVSVLPGMNATPPAAPVHDGYTFNGWSTSYRNVTEDRTINTIYISELATVTTHTVRFLVDGEEISTQEIVNGATASEPSETVIPKKEKQVFIGWDKLFDNVTSDLTINAIYADDINENGKADADENKFTIRFETNGNGTFTGETSFTGLLEGLKVYDFIELPEYEANPGYTFIGWDRELPEDDAVITDSFVYTAIFKDITKPEVIVSDIVDGQFNPEKFTFNAKDPNGIFSLSYTIRPKGEKDSVQSGYIKYQDILDDLTKTYSINELPDGEYELRISIRDVAENPNHGSVINFIVDNTNPTLEDVVINKNITNENSIEISGKIFDENIRYTSIRIFNSLNESVLQKTVFGNYDGLIENLDISTFDDNTYRVRLKVYDLAGNTEQINKTLVIDRTAPKVEVVIPKPGDFNPEQFTFKTNDENGLEGMNYTIWTKGQVDLKQSGGNQYKGAEEIEETYSINELPNGEYELRISIKDLAGNSNHVAPIYFTVDNTAPTVSNIRIEPQINGNIGGNVTVYFDLNDDSGINLDSTYVIFADGPNLIYRDKESSKLKPVLISGNSYKVEFNTKTFVAQNYIGKYNLQFTMIDILGNNTSSKPTNFKNILVDNSGPSSILKSPVSGSSINGTTRFEFEVSDDTGVSSGYIKLRNTEAQKTYTLTHDSGNIWYTEVDTKDLANGTYIIDARFVDLFGTPRFGADRGTVIVNNVEPAAPELEVWFDKTAGNVIYKKAGSKVVLYFKANTELKDLPVVKLGGQIAKVSEAEEDNVFKATLEVNKELIPESNLSVSVAGYTDLSGKEGTEYTNTTNNTKVIIDYTLPEISIKDNTESKVYTTGYMDYKIFSLISFELSDNSALREIEVNGAAQVLSAATLSDYDFIKIGENGGKYGKNTIIVRDLAGNEKKYVFYLDNKGPKIEVNEGNSEGNIETKTFSKVSFNISDNYLIKSYYINGTKTDVTLTKNISLNNIEIGNNNAIEGLNTLMVVDLMGNESSYNFTLFKKADPVPPVDLINKSASGFIFNDEKLILTLKYNSDVDLSKIDRYETTYFISTDHKNDPVDNYNVSGKLETEISETQIKEIVNTGNKGKKAYKVIVKFYDKSNNVIQTLTYSLVTK